MNRLPKFVKLTNDALQLIEYANKDIQVNKVSLLSAMKLDKLSLAEKRASESLALLIDLSTTPASILEAQSNVVANIDNIGELIAYNNAAYVRILKLISDELGAKSPS